ncbi:MAG TPA: tail fiber domain-containing protein [Candidatus Saccharimonadia bacterium]|nr:tail fiber domain-containing protein [Candidatus Saccharimonadia bacterium]
MRTSLRTVTCVVLLAAALVVALPAVASSFVYRGSLTDQGKPAEGEYGFRLAFYDAELGGKLLAPATTLDGVRVSNGAFDTELELVPSVHMRDVVWLEVEVRDAGGSFALLSQRQPVQPKALAAGVCWDTTGNTGNTAATNFIGNIDNVPLVLRTNNVQGLRLQPGGSFLVPSIVSGFSGNAILSSANGAAILGGGGTGATNIVWDNNSIVLGGANNQAGANDGNPAGSHSAAVLGGNNNFATDVGSVAIGGESNTSSGVNSVAMGSNAKALHASTFVWSDGDGTGGNFSSTGANQFIVRATGGVGINTRPPGSAFEFSIKSTGGNSDLALFSNNNNKGIQFTATPGFAGANDSEFLIGQANGTNYTERLRINGTGDLSITGDDAFKPGGGTWTAPSDRRIKRDIASISGAIDTLLRLRPVSFHYTDAYRAQHGDLADRQYLGFVAQEFAEVFPDAVTESGQALPALEKSLAVPAGSSILALDSNPALITAVAAAQELAVASDAQAERIELLEADNAKLRQRLDRIERLLERR